MLKRFSALLFLFFIVFCFIGCDTVKEENSDDETTTKPTTEFSSEPEALSENDNSNNGIYKGVFSIESVNISGAFKLDINNTSSRSTLNSIIAYLKINELNYSINGSVNDSNTNFVYTFENSEYSISINISESGIVNSTNLTHKMSNTTVNPIVVKEKSNLLARSYNGSWIQNGGGQGLWNCVVIGANITGSYASSNATFSGTLSEYSLNVSWDNRVNGIGPVGSASGSNNDNNTGSGTYSSKTYTTNTEFVSYSGTWSQKRTF